MYISRQPGSIKTSLYSRALLGGGGEDGIGLGVPFDVEGDVFIKGGAIVAILVGDALLEGVVGLRLDEEVANGLEDGADLGAGLPVLGLEQAEADGAGGVVGDVGVVDAGDELDDGRLEGVVDGELEDEAEAARVVGRRVGRR